MQKLEKILEEIDKKQVMLQPFDEKDRPTGIINVDVVKAIIRKHLNDGWVPVEERLPEEYETVMAVDEYNYNFIAVYNQRYGFKTNDICGDADKVIAWRPMPEPYKPERSEEE